MIETITKISVLIKTDWKSAFLQNKIINEKNILNYSFWIVYKNNLQIYIFNNKIEDDLSKNEIINKYRHAKKYSLKITINLETNEIIWIWFWKILDSWLGWFNWIIKWKYYKGKYIWLINWNITNNHNDTILIKWSIGCEIFEENLSKIFLDKYKINSDKYISYMLIDEKNWKNILTKKYYSAYLFEPHEWHFQLTLWTKNDNKINLISYRYLEKDISIVFLQDNWKLIYFYTKINNEEIFYFKKDLLSNKSKVNYTDNIIWYWNISLDLKIPIDKLWVVLIINWNLPTIGYPNY